LTGSAEFCKRYPAWYDRVLQSFARVLQGFARVLQIEKYRHSVGDSVFNDRVLQVLQVLHRMRADRRIRVLQVLQRHHLQNLQNLQNLSLALGFSSNLKLRF
jgi:hypothetical protein